MPYSLSLVNGRYYAKKFNSWMPELKPSKNHMTMAKKLSFPSQGALLILIDWLKLCSIDKFCYSNCCNLVLCVFLIFQEKRFPKVLRIDNPKIGPWMGAFPRESFLIPALTRISQNPRMWNFMYTARSILRTPQKIWQVECIHLFHELYRHKRYRFIWNIYLKMVQFGCRNIAAYYYPWMIDE